MSAPLVHFIENLFDAASVCGAAIGTHPSSSDMRMWGAREVTCQDWLAKNTPKPSYLSGLRAISAVHEHNGSVALNFPGSQGIEISEIDLYHAAVLKRWYDGAGFRAGQRKIIEYLIDRQGQKFSRAEISEHLGIPAGTLPSYLSGLKTAGLLDESNGLRANDALFMGG